MWISSISSDLKTIVTEVNKHLIADLLNAADKMPSFLEHTEMLLSRMLINKRGRDALLFTRNKVFANISSTGIIINSPDVGESGSRMLKKHAQDGEDQFPKLEWDTVVGVKEYLLVVEDPDAPLPNPAIHGIFYKISPEIKSLSPADFEIVNKKTYELKGGFKYGKNIRSTIYGGPRPMLNHGNHRYFYQLVALKQPLVDLPAYPTKNNLFQVLEKRDNILAWGEWIGSYERKLE